jgi:hypothetical protein
MRRELNVPHVSFEELHAQRSLQHAHMMTDGRWRDRQFSSGLLDTEMPGRSLKGTQRMKGRQPARGFRPEHDSSEEKTR